MTDAELENLKYPIGKFNKPVSFSASDRAERIGVIERLPARLSAEMSGLSDAQCDTPYRPGGWTIRQVVHHLADSHLNSFVRMKLTLTEENPTIKPYFEDRWATTPDAAAMAVKPGLDLLSGLHARWTVLLRSLGEKDFQRTFFHPQRQQSMSLDENLALYAWHCSHHLAHITGLKKMKGW